MPNYYCSALPKTERMASSGLLRLKWPSTIAKAVDSRAVSAARVPTTTTTLRLFPKLIISPFCSPSSQIVEIAIGQRIRRAPACWPGGPSRLSQSLLAGLSTGIVCHLFSLICGATGIGPALSSPCSVPHLKRPGKGKKTREEKRPAPYPIALESCPFNFTHSARADPISGRTAEWDFGVARRRK